MTLKVISFFHIAALRTYHLSDLAGDREEAAVVLPNGFERLEGASRGDSCTVLVSGLPEDCRPREVPALLNSPYTAPVHLLCANQDKKVRVLLLTDRSRSPGVLLDEVS